MQFSPYNKQKQSTTCRTNCYEWNNLHFIQNLLAEKDIEGIKKAREDTQDKSSIKW